MQKQKVKMLIISSIEWAIAENLSLPSFLSFINSFSRVKIDLALHYSEAKKYLTEKKYDIIVISENLMDKEETLEEYYKSLLRHAEKKYQTRSLGLELYEELKKDSKYKDIPIILQSCGRRKKPKLRDVDFFISNNTWIKDEMQFFQNIIDRE